MKSLVSAVTAVGATCLLLSNQTMADDGGEAMKMAPAEIFTCNYNKGKDREDLDKVIARWNDWTDKNNAEPYTAWLLTPAFYGPEITFDIGWLGAWPSYAAMGSSEQTWREKGAKINNDFFEVFSCDTHGSMAVLPMQAPKEAPKTSVVRFLNCTVADGHKMDDVVAAHHKLGSYMDSKGSTTSGWLFFPGMGAGQIDYDYKLVLANADYPSLATDSEIFANGGGWKEAGKIFGDMADCDSPRLYHAEMVRNGAPK
jgi:hypothetical protein